MLEQISKINYPAVLVAGFAAFMLGGLWYTAMFGKARQRLSGYPAEQPAAMQAARPMPVFFGGMIVCYIVAAFALALIMCALAITGAGPGALVGFVVFLAVAAFAMTGHIASNRPLALYCIDAGFALVFLPLIGAILGAWR